MSNPTKSTITTEQFKTILIIAAFEPQIKKDVFDNYWENRWWPLSVDDWRLRILFAGLSTRVSYRGINTYQTVRNNLTSIGYKALSYLDKESFILIIKPLGLSETRWKYWQSLKEFANSFPDNKHEPKELQSLSNQELIEIIKFNIKGAGYKVAQCCVLYIRGYNCGVVPIDSGLKDVFGPCLGFTTRNSANGNELMRKQIESLAQEINYQDLWKATGYQKIADSWDASKPNTWWVHLVLIYFKRRFCNLKDNSKCPLLKNDILHPLMKCKCMN